MKIILDAMGGDNAPGAVVRGALEAAKEFGVQIVLVGRGADILASMKAQGWDTLPDGVELANAEDVVDMHWRSRRGREAASELFARAGRKNAGAGRR